MTTGAVTMLRRVCLAAACVVASTLPAAADWKAPREALEQVQPLERGYAILYSTDGADAFPAEAADAPRRSRWLFELSEQILAADTVYRRDLGLVPPLSMPRYGEGTRIDVQVFDIGRGMGSTGDELFPYDYRAGATPGPVLSITLANRWRPPNRTPQHEVFHAYQYAYTFFKNAWYLEGMARSMESLFHGGGWRTDPLPASQADLDALLARSYDADGFWNRLALACDPGCDQGDRSRAPGAAPACGKTVVGPLLQALDVADDRAGRDRGLGYDYWPEKEQRSAANTPYMLAALKSVVESCPIATDPELARFDAVLAERLGDRP